MGHTHLAILPFFGGIGPDGVSAADRSQKAIEEITSKIQDAVNALNMVGAIVDGYSDIRNRYEDLNEFWGRMCTAVKAIQFEDDAIALIIGESMLGSISIIKAALQKTEEMSAACATFLSALDKQGIKVHGKP